MTIRYYVLLALALLLVLPLQAHDAASETPIAIRDVTVIPMTAVRAIPGQTVILRGGEIVTIGPAKRVRIPRHSVVVEGNGKYLIPGLWDMHVHAAYGREVFNRLFLANGVTGVRDMGSYAQPLADWRKEITTGKSLSPHLYSAGPIVDGSPPSWPFSLVAADGDKGREAVAQAERSGADFIKVYDLLPRDAYLGIVAEAKRREIPFAGHVPHSLTLLEASNAGQRSVEHLSGLWLACSTRETEIRQEIGALIKANPAYLAYGPPVNRLVAVDARQTFSPRRATALFKVLAKNDTYQTPTTVTLRYFTLGGADYDKDKHPFIRYAPKGFTSWWGSPLATAPTHVIEQAKSRFRSDLRMVGLMHRAGVKLLAGTDLGNPFIFAGFSLHEELLHLVEAGLTPWNALRTATRNPAEFFGIADRTGTIEKGKQADLVLLDADPLADIANTRKIHAVVANGRLFTREDLDRNLSEAQAEAAKFDTAMPPPGGHFPTCADSERARSDH